LRIERLLRAGRLVTVSTVGTLRDVGVAIGAGKIMDIGPWEKMKTIHNGAEVLDHSGDTVIPGLVDPHSHNLEYGGGTAWGMGEPAQLAAGTSLLLEALRAGVTTVGENLLGHHVFRRSLEEYEKARSILPLNVVFSVGTCVVGTDPITCLSAARPGEPLAREALLDTAMLRELAKASEAPGEHVFLNATPANLPLELAPHAGSPVFSRADLRLFVESYHVEGRPVGAHLEGPDSLEAFLEMRGDVVHHGHTAPQRLLERMAKTGTSLVATPSGGTRSRPNSPEEIARAVEAGVTVAIASDAVLPFHPEAHWYHLPPHVYSSSHLLAYLASPALRFLAAKGMEENGLLALLTLNGAKILGLSDRLGSIERGKQADLVVAPGIPGLEVLDPAGISAVYVKGEMVCRSTGPPSLGPETFPPVAVPGP
jgi:imidazolonepropionase-like amidohydrolase